MLAPPCLSPVAYSVILAAHKSKADIGRLYCGWRAQSSDGDMKARCYILSGWVAPGAASADCVLASARVWEAPAAGAAAVVVGCAGGDAGAAQPATWRIRWY